MGVTVGTEVLLSGGQGEVEVTVTDVGVEVGSSVEHRVVVVFVTVLVIVTGTEEVTVPEVTSEVVTVMQH